MRYVEFRDAIENRLRRSPEGLTWRQLRERLNLPYDRPCPTWTRRLEQEMLFSAQSCQCMSPHSHALGLPRKGKTGTYERTGI